ncbi:MAG: rRNA maturation RNase YbeY [Deltaproteobacteria bacterium]|nr:rRNA maturation RNase YbeY [Deltaproteobacteria bacterium]
MNSVIDVRYAGLPPGSWRPSRSQVASILRSMVRAAGAAPAELAVLLVGDTAMRTLNRRYRRIDRATDVLSFGLPRVAPRISGRPQPLGDLVVSLPTCLRQARTEGSPPLRRLAHLMAHGILHLLGRDHRTPAAFARMERLAHKLVEAALGAAARHSKPGA